jgi:hypothetical protein
MQNRWCTIKSHFDHDGEFKMLKKALEQYKNSQAKMSNEKSSVVAENENKQPNARPQLIINFIEEFNQSKRLPIQQPCKMLPIQQPCKMLPIQQPCKISPLNNSSLAPQKEYSTNPYLFLLRRQAMSDLTVLSRADNAQSHQPHPREEEDELIFDIEIDKGPKK